MPVCPTRQAHCQPYRTRRIRVRGEVVRKARIHERGQLQTQASGFPPWEFTIAADGRFPFAVLLFLFLRIALTIFNSPSGMERAPEVSNSGSEQAQRHGNSVGWKACVPTHIYIVEAEFGSFYHIIMYQQRRKARLELDG